MNQIYLYCLGEAASRYEMVLHGWIAMGNHQHLVVHDVHGHYPAFLAHLHKMIAKALNAHWGRWENLWATEQPNAVYLVEAQDRLDKLLYLLANPVEDDLVDRVTDWPGAISLAQVLSGESITVERPEEFFSDEGSMPEAVTLQCARPQGFEKLTQTEWRQLVSDGLAARERRARANRQKCGRGILGRKEILRTEPTSTPRTLEPRRGLRPNIACKDPKRRALELNALQAFRLAYRETFSRWVQRAKDVLFPAGTYRLMLFGVPCAPFDLRATGA